MWRTVKQDVGSFVVMTSWQGPLPKQMMDTFLELDNFLARMESKKMSDELKKTVRANER